MERVIDFIYEKGPEIEEWSEVWKHALDNGNVSADYERDIYWGSEVTPPKPINDSPF
jgi:hypothetical protein